MKLATRLLHKEIAQAVTLASVAFLALLMFFDLIGETRFINRTGVDSYGISDALLHMLLSAPMHLYELLPICVLIGTVFVMARYAQTSQFTILRTGGLGPGRALRILLSLGVVFVGLTFVLGDYVAPWSERMASSVRAEHLNESNITGYNAWLRERKDHENVIINVGTLRSNGEMSNLNIYSFSPAGQLLSSIEAQSATIAGTEWHLKNVLRQQYPEDNLSGLSAQQRFEQPLNGRSIHIEQEADYVWPSSLSAEMVHAAVLRPDGMSTIELFSYVGHLKANDQNAQKYELELWRKVFYPLSCLVMMMLALPFAYLHFRSGGIMAYVFVGIMVGISYLLLNNVLGYMGNIHHWTPLLTAATPGVLYTLVALSLFGWLVLKR